MVGYIIVIIGKTHLLYLKYFMSKINSRSGTFLN